MSAQWDELNRERLLERPWLSEWRTEITRWIDARRARGEAQTEWRVMLDQRAWSLGAQVWSRALPEPSSCDAETQRLITRFLLAELNNHCWLALRQPPRAAHRILDETDETDETHETRAIEATEIKLGGPWATLVRDALAQTTLIESLSPSMLYGPITVSCSPLDSPDEPEWSPEPASRRAQSLNATHSHLNAESVLGVDIGGTNIKLLWSGERARDDLSPAHSISTHLISRWRVERLDEISRYGLCAHLAMELERSLAQLTPNGAWPHAIGVSWPGPVRDQRLLGSVTITETLEAALKHRADITTDVMTDVMTDVITDSTLSPPERRPSLTARSALERERSALYSGELVGSLHDALRARGFGGSLFTFRDAYCDAFGIAAALKERQDPTSALYPSVALTLGTSVAGFYISERQSLATDTYLCEYGRLIIDMHETRSQPHRSTGLRGTLRGCLGGDGFARSSDAALGEALAYTALELYEGLGARHLYVSGGNATERALSIGAQHLELASQRLNLPTLTLRSSPAVSRLGGARGATGSPTMFTTALGVQLATRAARQELR